MTKLHKNRRDRIEKLRKDAVELLDHRKSSNFDVFAKKGPYSGLRLLNSGEHHENNGDEGSTDHNKFAGSFSKGLEHDGDTGFVAEPQFDSFKKTLEAIAGDRHFPDPSALTAIDHIPRPLVNDRPFVNPLAGVCADIEGLDSFDAAVPPAPKLRSLQAGTELAELYWMALVRDVPFHQWSGSSLVADAIAELQRLNHLPLPAGEERFAEFYDTGSGTANDTITIDRLFRGSASGNDAGPYISQFLIQDIPYGSIDFEQKQYLLRTNDDSMRSWDEWVFRQKGGGGGTSRDKLEVDHKTGRRRHMITLRDLAHYVHFDALHEAYFNAALFLNGNGFPLARSNPYSDPARKNKQEGFGTLGGPYILALLTEVATRALKAMWHQKWYVHRRLRPEAMAGRVALVFRKPKGGFDTLVHSALLHSDAVAKTVSKNMGSALLPMAFPEGSPMHPSYGAGHATVAGACVTILKALFHTGQKMGDKARIVDVASDGTTSLAKYPAGADLTVGGELNKLAANIAIGRNAAGVHYRTDYTKSAALGEAIAVSVLQEQALTFKESGVIWEIESFSGRKLAITGEGTINASAAAGHVEGAAAAAAPSVNEQLPLRDRSLFTS